MGKHVTTIVPAAQGWQGRCGCRATSPIVSDYFKAESWGYNHKEEVRKTQERLARRGLSLEKTRDYYWEKANDETESDEHREQWAALAVELDHRVGPEQMPGAEPLF